MSSKRAVGIEAIPGLAVELQETPTDEVINKALRLSESFPGEVVSELWAEAGQAETVGITGPPGVGKSTLIPGLVSSIREQGQSVAVIAVDPSSPISGGSIMGDRGRMLESADSQGYNMGLDKEVWIRSFSAAGNLGGVSAATLPSILTFDVLGKEVIIVETVGVGQSELDITSLVDTTVVVLQPGLGDSIQAMKSGLMEIPDILCLNKKGELGQKALSVLKNDLSGISVPAVEIDASSGEGTDLLREAIEEHRENLGDAGLAERRQRSLEAQLAQLSVAYSGAAIKNVLQSEMGKRLLEEVGSRRKDPFVAAKELRRLI